MLTLLERRIAAAAARRWPEGADGGDWMSRFPDEEPFDHDHSEYAVAALLTVDRSWLTYG
jgi:hypothetical protein